MLTPRFSCSQTAVSVIVSIYCPSVRASDVELNVNDTLLTVHINPYFLRLNFTHSLIEDDDSNAQYDPSSGYLTLTLTKETPGQEFPDLDLLAKLLAPRPPVEPTVIEVISSDSTEEEDELVSRTQNLSLEQTELLKAAENDWQLPQVVPDGSFIEISGKSSYGFLELHSGYFVNISYTENEVNELGLDAETCPPVERPQRRIAQENKKWDEEHYMADYVDDEQIQELLHWKHPHCSKPESFHYTDKENLAMLTLPRKEYLPSASQTHNLYLTLISLLFSYAYDSRTTSHDPTPESAWTICSLTPAFAALNPPPYASEDEQSPCTGHAAWTRSEVSSVLIPSYRRSLAFPLYRSFALAQACQGDVAHFLLNGRRTVLRCLMEMKDILDHHEVYYIYSKIWLDDFCVWLQGYATDESLLQLGELVQAILVPKSALDWNLEQLEAVVDQASDHESDSDDESESDIE